MCSLEQKKMKNPQSSLPPGFRFHPTDDELIRHYLKKKVASTPFPVSIIADVDIYKFDPWELPDKAAFGEKEWYFFSPRDRKYPNGARPNRAAASGYWKATGTDKVIMAPTTTTTMGSIVGQENIGVKKALVFYKGRPPKGSKTNWIMHEYRLTDSPTYASKPIKPKDSSMRLDDWVLCRIYKKSQASSPSATLGGASSDHEQEEEIEQFVQETLLPLKNSPTMNNNNKTTLMPQKSTSFSNLLDAMDYSLLRSFLSDNNNSNNVFSTSSGFDSTTPTTFHDNVATLDQPSFFNGHNTINTNSYLFQKLPQLNNSAPTNVENKLKRHFSDINNHEDNNNVMHPSKKFMNSCSFISSSNNSTGQSHDMAQYNFVKQPLFLNQQLLLTNHLQFQG